MRPMQASTGLDRLDGGGHNAGVADHVAVGEVRDDKVVLLGSDGFDALVGDLFGAHLRDEVIGRELFRRRYKAAILALALLLNAAVEEEGDVSILLSLGEAELLQAVRADDSRRACSR